VAVDAEAFRSVLAGWASGVTIVTSRLGPRVHGMTVSAFCSVSLEPPLVLICADKSSNTLELIDQSRVFSVNILAAGQDALSNRFASKKEEHRRFEGLDCPDGVTGCPLIPGALGSLDCNVTQAIDAGDHVVYIGRVEAARTDDAPPLVYFRSRYRGLSG
jgi:flavin reductase (DIM6/NTAB) family NADH-FMN oxidoreductase RutF